jgi:hypothetical protein
MVRGETGTVCDYWCDPGRELGSQVPPDCTPKRYSRRLRRVMYMSALIAIGCGPASRAC